ncbi:MAG: assimilatory nitrate reductase NasA [Haloferacaceae archaeon]
MTEPVPTTCMRCAVGCGHLQYGAEEGYGISTVRGDAAHPVSRGLACQRGIRETKDPEGDWLTTPLVREGGHLREATWAAALDRVAAGFAAATAETPHGVAVLGSGQQTNEAAYALGKVARGGLGTRYYDANTTLCMASAVTAYYDAFGSDAPPCSYDDVPDAETHLVWGANPATAHPVMFRWIEESARDDDSRLLVVDPVETRTADAADVHVGPDPGTDLALARAVLARVVERGAVDEDFVAAATVGFDALRDALPPATAAAETAGVPLEDVDAIAAALDDPTLLYWGMGVNQSAQGTDTARALIDLCLATGNLEPGSGPFSLTGQANSMGTRVCSSKGSWPGQRAFDDPDHRRTVADAWGVPVERLPDDPGPGPVGTVEAVDDGPVEAIYAVATNPAAGMPDADRVRERLDDAFLVVQDAFHTETTALADVVLPAATWGESEGTAMNMERTVSRVRPAMDLPADVRTDLDVVAAVGERVAPGLFGVDADPVPDLDPEAVFDEFVALTAGTAADCSGITYERLEAVKAVRWPAPDATTSGGYRYHDDGWWSFPTPSGDARFSTGGHGGLAEPPDEEFPLTLTTARDPDGYNTGVRSRDVDDPGPIRVRVHPDTAADAGIDAGHATVESRRAAVAAAVERDPAVPAGLLRVPVHHPDANRLTLPAVDPKSAEPNFKQCAVRLRPAPDAPTTPVAEASGDD